MKRIHFLLIAVIVVGLDHSANAAVLTPQGAEGRLRMALQIARERNDKALVAEVKNVGQQILAASKAGKSEGLDAKLRAFEIKVGIDPGGWSMAGQPLFHATPQMLEKSKLLGPKLTAAMMVNNPAGVRAVTAEMLAVLGDQAGVPDGRRAGKKPAPLAISEADATKLFLDALASESSRLRPIVAGKPLPDQRVRFYGYLLDGAASIRPFAATHQPARLGELDALTQGLAKILIGLQQPAGHFPFPDLRGKDIRFGAMAEKQIAAGTVEVRDRWLISPDPDGGTQFDTGICGNALLLAGQIHGNDVWKKAGLRAANWALVQPCVANFNYNAFSVSLLAHAFRASGEAKYLDGALTKFRVGVAPGQAPNGRWLDPHNARTVYHLIILRALGDLTAALPTDRATERAELDAVTRPALKALLDEFDAMGHTVEALPEMQTLAALFLDDERLQAATKLMAAGLVAKCTHGKRVRMNAQPNQLAATARMKSAASTR